MLLAHSYYLTFMPPYSSCVCIDQSQCFKVFISFLRCERAEYTYNIICIKNLHYELKTRVSTTYLHILQQQNELNEILFKVLLQKLVSLKMQFYI